MFKIYKYTSPSGKHYIGITNNEPRRKQEHRKKKGENFTCTFSKAIQKYGFDELEYEVIASTHCIEEAKALEIQYIEQYDSYRNGYNSTLGGDLSITKGKLSDEDVVEIRKKLEENKLLMIEIANEYNISESVISSIKDNKSWRHIKGGKVIKRQTMVRTGEENGSSKLTEKEVREIKVKLMSGTSRKDLVIEYGISKTLVQLIATEEAWSHIQVEGYKPKKVRNGNAKLDVDTVRRIWIDRKNGLTQKQLFEKYKVSRSTVQNLLIGKIWKDVYEEMK